MVEKFVSGAYRESEDVRNKPRPQLGGGREEARKATEERERDRQMSRYYHGTGTPHTRKVTNRIVGDRDQ